MEDNRSNKAGWITTLIVVGILGSAAVSSTLLRWLGDWEQHGWGLGLAERIVWGCCLVAALAVILTRVTIFGWSFRHYFRWPGDGAAPDGEKPPGRFRPVRAPWPKSAAASFSSTVVLVSLTGTAVIAWAVVWMLKDVIGDWAYWLVTFILFTAWWVLCIAAVLTRVAIFGWQRKRAIETQRPNNNGAPALPDQSAVPASGIQERSDHS
jgi:hypothetical protein